ncbi:nitrate- and nitrite sensing domain-containing protein [Pontibacterium granulatum]|uniref:nitrate- and nitrite sensing domain-containing protein n=1 Tax=Pontibacterium granulatum TaxID=2036029 RepID=UPI00249AD4EB|nr:nitrate- and nitrite sensing domain-containing protein [Pontibacterium granulatum]MDI3325343.1 nitrate- and nitrite sensing domain-containing protein [Pontibacterium granulatum]
MTPSENVIMFITPAAIGFALIAGMLRLRHNRIRRAQQLRGLEWLEKLRLVLAHIQQHRGLSSGYIAGNHALLNELNNLHHVIHRDMDTINQVDEWICENSRWQGIEEHWQRLTSRFKTLERDDNINQHNRLLTNLIYLIEDIAETHHLTALCQSEGQGQRVWHDLLVAAEHIGQARAIGTAITASGQCDSVSRIQMSYLSSKIEMTSQNLLGNLGLPQQAQHKLRELLQCIQYRVLVDTPQIESKIYFNLASGCLEEIFTHYDREIISLRERIR